MYSFRRWRSGQQGMTIIEALILLAIFSIITIIFYQSFTLSAGYILNAKKRLIAVGLANEQMELLRSLPYDEVAVAGGIPDGTLDPDETLSVPGGQFRMQTAISYQDNSDDGTSALGTDTVPNDYKLVVIRVAWGNEGPAESVLLQSYFMPTGLETDAGGGVLSINVIDSTGLPVANASVRIQNSTISPSLDTTLVTGVDGNVSLVGAKASSQKYVVTISKTGYETVTTYPPYPITAYYPIDVHMTAINDAFTTGIVVSSRLSDLTITSENGLGVSVPDANFNMVGGRVLGVRTDFTPVYGYSDTALVTNGSARFELNDLSPGNYTVTPNEPGYTFWKVEYGDTNDANQIALDPGSSLTARMIFVDQGQPGYFLQVLDDDTGDPLEGVTVRLENVGLAYAEDQTTDRFGYVYFPIDVAQPLINGTDYDVTVTMAGYTTETTSVTINNLVTDTVNLLP